MELLKLFAGICLVIYGIYQVGQSIFFTTKSSSFDWGGFPASTPVLIFLAGILALVFIPGKLSNIGWGIMVVGVILIFYNTSIIVSPVSLVQFLIATAAMVGGLKLMYSSSRHIL
ncbi:hypothetical protein [Synechococcus elongatus]|uniref:hypothetical protein n=1 Tax=Synechococcus elongatus TaxID=32046 RepID=UPI0030D36647